MGTPKTLKQAIDLAIQETEAFDDPSIIAEAIERRVIDYLAQQFTMAMMDTPTSEPNSPLKQLWLRIKRQ